MGLRDLFRRRKTTDIADPMGMGDSDGDNEPGEGGPSIFKQELAEYRWAAQQEAINLARRGVDPERWDEGRMAFEFERALAHGHEALRDRVANYVGKRVRDEVRGLYSLAATVALIRDELRTVDDKLVQVTRDWQAQYDEVEGDELERSRYYRQNSATSRTIKALIATVLVISEFIISGLVFERIFADLPPGLGYVLAFGVTLALIVIPHYTALGLKEGLTQYHILEKRALEKDGQGVPLELQRSVHVEERDDRGFRRTAFLLGTGLLFLILPLSWIRATNDGGDFSWAAFFFLLLLQYMLSGYFFLREWLDHGHASHSLYKLDEEKEQVEATRTGVLSDLADAMAAFHDEAEDLIFTLHQGPRWDSHIVEAFNETARYYRHLITLEQPEYEQFITWARMPYLGSKSTVPDSGYPLDPVSEEHRSLEEDGPMGREWWLRTATEALRGVGSGVDDDDAEREDGQAAVGSSWLITKSPELLLGEFLRRYFDLEPDYKRPAGIGTPEAADEPEEPVPADSTTETGPATGPTTTPTAAEAAEATSTAERGARESDKRLQVVSVDEDARPAEHRGTS